MSTLKDTLVRKMRRWTDGSKYVVAHHTAPEDVKELATFVGSDDELVEWVNNHPYRYAAIYVVTCSDVAYDMKAVKPTYTYEYIPMCY